MRFFLPLREIRRPANENRMGQHYSFGGAIKEKPTAYARAAAGAEIRTEQDEYLMEQSAKEIAGMMNDEDTIFFENVKTPGWEPISARRIRAIADSYQENTTIYREDWPSLSDFIEMKINKPGGDSWKLTNTEKVLLNRYVDTLGWAKVAKPKNRRK